MIPWHAGAASGSRSPNLKAIDGRPSWPDSLMQFPARAINIMLYTRGLLTTAAGRP